MVGPEARMMLRRGNAIAVLALGLLGALLANRLLVALLFEVSPTDAVTLLVVAVLLLVIATLASVIPARPSTLHRPGGRAAGRSLALLEGANWL